MTVNTAQARYRARRREIREQYPHQVALPHLFCTEENFTAINRFCSERFGQYPKCFIIYAEWEGFERGEDMRVYCFAAEEQASEFCAYFEGRPFDEEACRDRGKGRKVWMMQGAPASRIMHGPLSVPCWLRESP